MTLCLRCVQIVHRRVQRADRLSLASAQLDILEKALDEQKVYVVVNPLIYGAFMHQCTLFILLHVMLFIFLWYVVYCTSRKKF